MIKTIESLSDVINLLKDLKPVSPPQTFLKGGRYFRGQANFNWGLSPSLYREGLFQHEKILINETLHYLPGEFDMHDKFSSLVKMQHYGLKTRLLDLSENPLVALYFACISLTELDGALYIINNAITHYSDDSLVELTMDYAFNYSGFPIDLEEVVLNFKGKQSVHSSRRSIEKIEHLLDDLTLDAFCVAPKINNSRLKAQQGSFLCFGMKLDKIETSTNPGILGKKYGHFKPAEFHNIENLKIGAHIFKIRIPHSAKKQILKELEVLNFHEGSLFMELEHQIHYINNKIKKNIEFNPD